jgi:tRNA pseudouridine38-40 synthase
MRVGMVLEYDGTDYCGWQLQPGLPTIQGALEQALSTILGEAVRIEAAGRTDAGVHARGQVAAFTPPRAMDLVSLHRGVNALAGPGIVVRRLAEVANDFDPRRDARSRTYEYRICNLPWPSPFTARYAWHVHRPLDVPALARAAEGLVGEHDFSCFQAADCDAENPVRRILESNVEARDGEIVYRVTATAFLRHMVRTIVGTLAEVGRGERTIDDVAALVASRDRTRAGPTAPAHGLCLLRVDYDGVFAGGS